MTENERTMLGALQTIIAQTEPDAIPHADYGHLARDIHEVASAAVVGFTDDERVEAMLGLPTAATKGKG